MRAPTLAEELDGARRALDAAGIATTVDDSVMPSAAADEVLAWVVREGATNVLRHSGASACRIALTDVGGRIALTIADDGVGGPSTPAFRTGGLEGLRDRVVSAGGALVVEPSNDGFRLVATLPGGGGVIRVLLAEDQAMMRGALAVLLDLEDDLEVVAQVSDGADIVPTALEVRPDVALLDIELPHVSGLEAAAALTEALPECRVVMVTTFGRPGYLQRAMAAGAVGFLVKDGPVEGLAEAIRKVAGGATVVDPELAGKALRTAVSPLTPRERDVLAAAEDGSTVADIAGRLHLRRARCATTCPTRSARPAPATGPRLPCSRAATAGSERRLSVRAPASAGTPRIRLGAAGVRTGNREVAVYEAPHALSRRRGRRSRRSRESRRERPLRAAPGTLPSVVFGTTCGPATPIAWTANLIEDASLTRLTCQPPT